MTKPVDSATDSDARQNESEDFGSAYSAEYLRDVADKEARRERIEELKRRIEHSAYEVDPDRIAEELLLRGDLE